LGLPAFSLEGLLAALQQGSCSPLLGLLHVTLLRQAQADMEVSHATGVMQVRARAASVGHTLSLALRDWGQQRCQGESHALRLRGSTTQRRSPPPRLTGRCWQQPRGWRRRGPGALTPTCGAPTWAP
jgi:hypothetical protein